MPRRLAWIAALFIAVGSEAAVADDDPYAAARAEFQAAMTQIAAAPPAAAAADSQALRNYPLYPYLEAARLQRRLDASRAADGDPDGIDADVQAFLILHEDQPVAGELRRAWLASLAARHAWKRFLDVYRPDRDTSATLRCQSAAARIATGRTASLLDDAIQLWLTPRSLPDECDPVIDWLQARGRLDDDLVLRRARLALAAGESGLARHLVRTLPAEKAAPVVQWAALIDQPRKAIDDLIAAPDRAVDEQALLDGWTRLSRTDAAAAADLYPALVQARKLDARHASPFALATALGMAWSRVPGALDFFARVDADDYDERAFEWRARAALWTGDWTKAREAIAAMPAALAQQTRWRYWAARAAEQLGDKDRARAGYDAVLPTDNWYAMFSAARLGRPFSPTLQPLGIKEADLARLATDPGFVRAHELLACRMSADAIAEWRAAFDALPSPDQLQAVGLAARWGWHMEAIAAAARQGLFNDYELLYPRPYDPEVRAAASRTGLPEALIYAVIRQESLYRADAGSRAGALGLMQLLPSTARRTANRWDLPRPTPASLLVPAVNVPLGAATLKSLLERAAGQWPLAIAGYNAGPAAVRRWLPAQPMDADVWVENIPFNETRLYVQRVAWHTVVFRWLTDRRPVNVGGWLTQISTPAPDAALQP